MAYEHQGGETIPYRRQVRRLRRQLEEAKILNQRIIDFPLLNYKSWLVKYRQNVRGIHFWEELKNPEPEVARIYVTPEVPVRLYHPWLTKEGEWRSGKPNPPQRCNPRGFDGTALLEIPALQTPKGLLILDGSHRILELEPAVMVVDALVLGKRSQYRAFVDMLNPWWGV